MAAPQTDSYQFEMRVSGRCGSISCHDGAQHLELEWEMSGAAEHDLALAPLDLKAWHTGQLISKEQQLEILDALRSWLNSKKIRSDVDAIRNPIIGPCRCMRSLCDQFAIERSAYCPDHFDESLLR